MTAVPELDPREAAELLAGGQARAVDVREPGEWEAGRIAGASHVPLGELAARWPEVERGGPIVFVCRSGARSGLATDAARRAGAEAWNLAGGMRAWAAAGLPLEPEGGHVP